MRVESSKIQQVQGLIRTIEEENDVTVILCVEAGSRAWDIASVDSDYDVRFIYVHNDKRRYVSFSRPSMEIIEIRLDNLDIKGYDIREAYRFIMEGEVNVYEWLASDIVYKEDKEKRWLIDRAAEENFDVGSVARRYYGMVKRVYVKDMHWIDKIKVKKYLYCLRSIMCCRYVLENNRPVPLRIDKLLEKMPVEYADELNRLLKQKTEDIDNAQTERSPALEDKVLNEIGMLENMMRGRWPNQGKSERMDGLLLEYIRKDT